MIRMDLQLDLQYDIDAGGADFVFNIHAAHTPSQVVMSESLVLSQQILPQLHTDPITRNRYMRRRALPGPLKVSYKALVDITHQFVTPGLLAEVPVSRLGRLAGSVLEPSGTVVFSFQGERDDEGKLYVDLRIQAGLVLECQRCLGALEWPCDVQNRLLLLRPGDPLPEDELENEDEEEHQNHKSNRNP